MDWLKNKSETLNTLKKYRYGVVALLLGIGLMCLPQTKPSESVPSAVEMEETTLQQSLEQILSRLEGAGKVKVLLTEAEGQQTLYQTDEDFSLGEKSGDNRRDTVLVTNSQREETGLVRQVIPPRYLGAVILCQGAGSASVRLAVVEAVSSVTGLRSDRITVLKMK